VQGCIAVSGCEQRYVKGLAVTCVHVQLCRRNGYFPSQLHVLEPLIPSSMRSSIPPSANTNGAVVGTRGKVK
jgi:hypothetical protein